MSEAKITYEYVPFDKAVPKPSKNLVEVVRCKDCKHWEKYSDVPNIGNCPVLDNSRRDNWFCADGERK